MTLRDTLYKPESDRSEFFCRGTGRKRSRGRACASRSKSKKRDSAPKVFDSAAFSRGASRRC